MIFIAGELTTDGANLALNKVFRNTGTSPTTLYVGLATAALTDSSTLASITEVSTAGYSRQTVTFSAPTGDPAAIENSADVTFGPFTADPPSVAYCFVTDAASGTSGTIYAHWSGTAVDAAINESLRIAAGALDFTLD